VNIRDGGMNRTLAGFARASNGGLIVTVSAFSLVQRDAIVDLAARYKLPAVFYERSFVAAGGLISYGLISLTSIGARALTSIASSKAKSRPICRCRRRPGTRSS